MLRQAANVPLSLSVVLSFFEGRPPLSRTLSSGHEGQRFKGGSPSPRAPALSLSLSLSRSLVFCVGLLRSHRSPLRSKSCEQIQHVSVERHLLRVEMVTVLGVHLGRVYCGSEWFCEWPSRLSSSAHSSSDTCTRPACNEWSREAW